MKTSQGKIQAWADSAASPIDQTLRLVIASDIGPSYRLNP